MLDRLGLEPWDVARPKETREAGIDLPKDAEPPRRLADRPGRPPARDPAADHHRSTTAPPWSAATTQTLADVVRRPRPALG